MRSPQLVLLCVNNDSRLFAPMVRAYVGITLVSVAMPLIIGVVLFFLSQTRLTSFSAIFETDANRLTADEIALVDRALH